jgi:ribonucleoside-diphosphate reductase alpha chain
VKWITRDVKVTSATGEIIFEQAGVEFPETWTQNATQIVTSKYFHGQLRTSKREKSLKQLIDRVVLTIAGWGRDGRYFASEEDAEIFTHELTDILLNQRASFNSPVWFNCGAEEHPQCSACFINSVDDDMDSILDLAKTEGIIFKHGSGSGVNLSKLRGKGEPLSSGGTSSGPLSFMRGYDAFAGSIKSGGKTRRAAKMVLLDDWHPDVMEFIDSKMQEEKKAWALIDAGYDGSFTGEAYSSVFFQNANHSVRVSDAFMKAVLNNDIWRLRGVVSGNTWDTVDAKVMLDRISSATHLCGDPGLQFTDQINRWHTCKNSGPINASNPCSEYVFLDDTACNLASINLMKYRNEDGSFDVNSYIHTIDLLISAQEIIVGNASYPTEMIGKNSHVYRTLGLGFTNLGALLMSLGFAYDSDEGRNYAAALSSVMTGRAYHQSARIAGNVGAFDGYAKNAIPMMEVMGMHRNASKNLDARGVDGKLYDTATTVWDEVIELGEKHGYRNAQASVIAPTGTISFMMDADTTGIEPDIALIKYKKLVGGGYMKIVNNSVPLALDRLDYSESQIKEIVAYIDENGYVDGAPHLSTDHYPIFDTSFRTAGSDRSIQHMAHITMMAAVQPFISGAISKTVNMPEESTIEDINNAYIKAWELGLKAVAIYRDNSKRLQPLNTKDESRDAEESLDELKEKLDTDAAAYNVYRSGPVRRRLPETRVSKTHKFEVDGHEGYITVGLYEDGSPGEVFIMMSKQGSTLGGVMDSLAVLISISLQYGVPLSVLVRKFIHTKFEPAGMTINPKIPIASSIIDYIFRWLALEFLPSDERPDVLDYSDMGEDLNDTRYTHVETKTPNVTPKETILGDNKICSQCGAIAVRSGSCYACPECGTTSGCS